MKFKKESDFQIAFAKFIKNKKPRTTEVHELKLVKENQKGFNLKQWRTKYPHQLRGLISSKRNGCYHKLSDQSMGLKPFDSFYIAGADSFLVLYFNAQERFVMVDIEKIFPLTESTTCATFESLSGLGKVYSL